jgi:hypothetical protein
MALSGSFQGNIYGQYVLRVAWSATQNIANNTSVITAKIYLDNNWSLNIGGRSDNYIVIDGKTYIFKTSAISTTGTHLLATVVSDPIEHTASGTRTVSMSCSFKIKATLSGTYHGEINANGTVTLDTIPRASQPSCITWPEHTQDVGYFGDTISIHMNRHSSEFTHTVRYQFGSRSGTIATDVGTGTTWKIPPSLMELIPSSTSGSGTIYVETHKGNVSIGTKSCGFTAKVPDSVKPTVSFSLEDANKVDEIYGSPVKGLSRIRVTVSTTKAYSSPISSISTTIDGMTYSGASVLTNVLKNAGKSTVTTTVKDGRGRTATHSYDMNVQDYAAPSISELSVRRCDEDGTLNDRGDYIKVTFSASASPMNSKNTVTYKLEYKKKTDISYTTKSLADLANNFSVTDYSVIVEADGGNAYDVKVTATDKHKTSSRSVSASTAFTMMNFNYAGNGMGIGMVNTKDNTLQIALDVEFIGKVSGTIIDALLPVGSMVIRYDHINPGTLYPGTTWTRVYGAFPWFTDGSGQIGLTGGERTVTLTANQIPAHNHGGTYTNAGTARTHAWLASGGSAMGFDTVDAGGGQAHNNMPPYIQVSAWRRTA